MPPGAAAAPPPGGAARSEKRAAADAQAQIARQLASYGAGRGKAPPALSANTPAAQNMR
jgi:hypothetical protein